MILESIKNCLSRFFLKALIRILTKSIIFTLKFQLQIYMRIIG